MQRSARAGALALLFLALGTAAHGQQQIEWKQVVNTPKGLNMPAGIKAEILGLELGETYADTRSKLERLANEGIKRAQSTSLSQRMANELSGESPAKPLEEKTMNFRLPVPGGSMNLTATYVAELEVRRELPGSGTQTISETIRAKYSAPSSGHQLLLLERLLMYSSHVVADQPRISELVSQLKTKYGPNVQTDDLGSSVEYLFQFDNGTAITKPNAISEKCYTFETTGVMQSSHVPTINRTGNCDVILRVEIRYGISKDHAQSVKFTFSDNERAKANLTADFAFLNNYLRDLQTRTKGNTPKL